LFIVASELGQPVSDSTIASIAPALSVLVGQESSWNELIAHPFLLSHALPAPVAGPADDTAGARRI
jgi:hypothetical protein